MINNALQIFLPKCIKVQFVITIRLFKLYYSFCFSTLLINRKLYCKMLHFEMRAEYKCYQIWSNSMKNHTYGIYIALVCCDNRHFVWDHLKIGANFWKIIHTEHTIGTNSKSPVNITFSPTFVNLIENAIVITGVTVSLFVIIDKTFKKMSY